MSSTGLRLGQRVVITESPCPEYQGYIGLVVAIHAAVTHHGPVTVSVTDEHGHVDVYCQPYELRPVEH